jgi:hypothetical protein
MKKVKEPKVQVKRKKMDSETAQKMNKEMLLRRGIVREDAVIEGKEEEGKDGIEEKKGKNAQKIILTDEVKIVEQEKKGEEKGTGKGKEKEEHKPEIVLSNDEILQESVPLRQENSVETVSSGVDLILTEKSEIEIEFEKVIPI